ncbi:S24 family peptidase [Luteibacter sp. UNC138MFCol5.1]|uniref:S24 family peptidase n=1 Tax=Luteibacter sp. UNC138MFCol5.1 TaxID=1502774 RepID=UPI001160503F|nr:S24 family peptidase [Luteibacter sp. UNC138MFCol5.1]
MGNELHASRASHEQLTELLSPSSQIRRLRVLDDAMRGTICAGDIITVDTGNRDIDSGHCYLVVSEGAVRVRRLSFEGAVLSVNADSPDKTSYPDAIVAAGADDFVVLGRVIDRQGDKGL